MILDRLLGRAGRRREQQGPPETAEHPPGPLVPAVPVPAPAPPAPGGGSAPVPAPTPTTTTPGPAPVPPVADGEAAGPTGPADGRADDPAGARVHGALVRGTVVTRDGWPLHGATITVLSGAGAASARSTTGTDGTFVLTAVPAGAATVLVAAPGHDPQARAVSVPVGAGVGTGGAPLEIGTVRLVRQDDLVLPPAGRWVIDPLHTSIVATAHHLGLSAVRGRLDLADGLITVAEPFTGSTVEVTIAAASIDTGVGQRDDHLRSPDFLDVGTHPLITYRGTGLTPTTSGGWILRGHLTLLGEAREVPLELEATGTGQDPWGGTRTAFRATAHLSRDDFHMSWNQAVGLGITVFGTTLRVTIDLEAVLQP